MAKVTRTKVKDRWKGKMWYRLHAASMFNYAVMAHTPADSPEIVNGRVAKSLSHNLQEIIIKRIL